MTLYMVKVHLQTFLSTPVTQKCQILSCDTLVANEWHSDLLNDVSHWCTSYNNVLTVMLHWYTSLNRVLNRTFYSYACYKMGCNAMLLYICWLINWVAFSFRALTVPFQLGLYWRALCAAYQFDFAKVPYGPQIYTLSVV
jgi:hypothetical protein